MSPNIPVNKLTFLLTSGLATVAAITYYYWRKIKSVPTEWRQVAKVTMLNLYPIKSGRRIEIQEAECTDLGIQEVDLDNDLMKLRDRAFIVYDQTDFKVKTARTFPTMVLMGMTAVNKSQVSVNAPGMDTLFITIPEQSDKAVGEINVISHHAEKIWGLDCGDEAAKWLSKYLYNKNDGARLAYHDGSKQHRRNLATPYKKQIAVFPKLSNKSAGIFSDLASYHLINQASVDDLNERCPERVTIHHFRPPIVISGEEAVAYSEDSWDFVRIGGEAVFRVVQPCTRCAMTTIHPDKGERLPNREPLKTLDEYRKLADPKLREVDSSPVMGQYLELIKPGIIKVGDSVYVGK